MNTITNVLFWISNALLIPTIIALVVLFIRSLVLIGSFYSAFMMRRQLAMLLGKGAHISISNLRAADNKIRSNSPSLLMRSLRSLLDETALSEEFIQYQFARFEDGAEADINTSRLLAKVGPVLGLMGTLISMSPALVGLSSGDIEGMAYNMQIVFATTVVGLVISLIGLITQQYKQRWYALDLARLEYISAQLFTDQSIPQNEN